MIACGVPWSIVALILGVLALLVIAFAIFALGGGEFQIGTIDPPYDDKDGLS